MNEYEYDKFVERKAELLETLRNLRGGDPDGAHYEADDALLACIDDQEITKAFKAIKKWYS